MAKRGFFIPYRYADSVMPPSTPIDWIERRMRDREPNFTELLERLDAYSDRLRDFQDARPPTPRWEQDWFPGLDGAAAYTLVRSGKPGRIVEIGSGHSTRFLAQAAADGDFACEVHCIDPAPRADISRLSVRLHRQVFSATEFSDLPELAAGDILFIDSSHIAMPGSDVDQLFGTILPGLAAGVLVHVHDILLPDPYPSDWQWRGYNEQGLVAALLGTDGYEVLFASHYVRTRMGARLLDSVMRDIPLTDGARETSLWLRKIVDPA